MEKAIRDKAHELDTFLFQVKQEVDQAQQEVIEDPENAPNVYNRYVTAFQKKLAEGKQKTAQIQQTTANTQVNVAMTTHDSILKDIKLDDGISTKATEYKNLATQGEKWESPVFSIGSAKTSTNIPSAGEITSKEHGVSNGGPTNGHTNGFSKQVDQALGTGTGQTTNGNTNLSNTLGENTPVLASSAAPVTSTVQ